MVINQFFQVCLVDIIVFIYWCDKCYNIFCEYGLFLEQKCDKIFNVMFGVVIKVRDLMLLGMLYGGFFYVFLMLFYFFKGRIGLIVLL